MNGVAVDTAEPHWAFRDCVQAHSLHYISGSDASIGCHTNCLNEWFFVAILLLSDPVAMPLCYAYDTAFRSGRSQVRYFTGVEVSIGVTQTTQTSGLFVDFIINLGHHHL